MHKSLSDRCYVDTPLLIDILQHSKWLPIFFIDFLYRLFSFFNLSQLDFNLYYYKYPSFYASLIFKILLINISLLIYVLLFFDVISTSVFILANYFFYWIPLNYHTIFSYVDLFFINLLNFNFSTYFIINHRSETYLILISIPVFLQTLRLLQT